MNKNKLYPALTGHKIKSTTWKQGEKFITKVANRWQQNGKMREKSTLNTPPTPPANLPQGPPQDARIKATAGSRAKAKTEARNDSWDQFIQIMQEQNLMKS